MLNRKTLYKWQLFVILVLVYQRVDVKAIASQEGSKASTATPRRSPSGTARVRQAVAARTVAGLLRMRPDQVLQRPSKSSRSYC